MSNSEGQELAKKPSPVNDVESTERETPAPELTAAEAEVVGIGSVLRRSRRESFVRKVSVGLRALGFVFSVLSFIIMLSNNHGNGRKYGEYEEYRYFNSYILGCYSILASNMRRVYNKLLRSRLIYFMLLLKITFKVF